MDKKVDHRYHCGCDVLLLWLVYLSNSINDQKCSIKMKPFITYPHPPATEPKELPKFTVYVNYAEYTWQCDVESLSLEFDGTFTYDPLTKACRVEWYSIPPDTDLWEAIDSEVKSLIF